MPDDLLPIDLPQTALPRSRTGCLFPLAHYAKQYGASIRSIKGWLAKGRAKQDPTPFDDPVKLAEWWGRHFEIKVPEKILSVARQGAPAAVPPPVVRTELPGKLVSFPAPGAASIPAAAQPPQVNYRVDRTDLEAVVGLDMAGVIDRLKRILTVNTEAYEKALCDPNADESKLTLLARRCDTCIERLRKMETGLIENRKKSGELVERSQLASEVAPVFEAMTSSLVTAVQSEFHCDREKAMAFADAWFERLRGSRFLTRAS